MWRWGNSFVTLWDKNGSSQRTQDHTSHDFSPISSHASERPSALPSFWYASRTAWILRFDSYRDFSSLPCPNSNSRTILVFTTFLYGRSFGRSVVPDVHNLLGLDPQRHASQYSRCHLRTSITTCVQYYHSSPDSSSEISVASSSLRVVLHKSSPYSRHVVMNWSLTPFFSTESESVNLPIVLQSSRTLFSKLRPGPYERALLLLSSTPYAFLWVLRAICDWTSSTWHRLVLRQVFDYTALQRTIWCLRNLFTTLLDMIDRGAVTSHILSLRVRHHAWDWAMNCVWRSVSRHLLTLNDVPYLQQREASLRRDVRSWARTCFLSKRSRTAVRSSNVCDWSDWRTVLIHLQYFRWSAPYLPFSTFPDDSNHFSKLTCPFYWILRLTTLIVLLSLRATLITQTFDLNKDWHNRCQKIYQSFSSKRNPHLVRPIPSTSIQRRSPLCSWQWNFDWIISSRFWSSDDVPLSYSGESSMKSYLPLPLCLFPSWSPSHVLHKHLEYRSNHFQSIRAELHVHFVASLSTYMEGPRVPTQLYLSMLRIEDTSVFSSEVTLHTLLITIRSVDHVEESALHASQMCDVIMEIWL